MTQPQAPALSAIKERQQKTWASGDFAMIGNLMVLMGELLCSPDDRGHLPGFTDFPRAGAHRRRR